MRLLISCFVGLAAFSCGSLNFETSEGSQVTDVDTCRGQPFGLYKFTGTLECPEGRKDVALSSIVFTQGDDGATRVVEASKVSQKDCSLVVEYTNGPTIEFNYFENDTLEVVNSTDGKCSWLSCNDEVEPISCKITGSK